MIAAIGQKISSTGRCAHKQQVVIHNNYDKEDDDENESDWNSDDCRRDKYKKFHGLIKAFVIYISSSSNWISIPEEAESASFEKTRNLTVFEKKYLEKNAAPKRSRIGFFWLFFDEKPTYRRSRIGFFWLTCKNRVKKPPS